jgi:hypothetical protein
MRCGEGIQAGVEPRIKAIWSASMIWRLSRGVTAVGSWTALMLDRPTAGALRPGIEAGGGLGWGVSEHCPLRPGPRWRVSAGRSAGWTDRRQARSSCAARAACRSALLTWPEWMGSDAAVYPSGRIR